MIYTQRMQEQYAHCVSLLAQISEDRIVGKKAVASLIYIRRTMQGFGCENEASECDKLITVSQVSLILIRPLPPLP